MITVYSGLPGAGKSYEVVTEVIYPALKEGRTVVGNIDIDLTAMGLPDADYKRVVFDSSSFWPVYQDGNVVSSGQLPRGALVVIDEAWQVLGSGRAQPSLLDFLPVHRHFSDDKGSVNFALVVQSPSLLDKKVLALTDSLFVMHNKLAMGMGKHYSVVIYGGHRAIKNQEINTLVRRYRSDRFTWYKSADAGTLHRKTDSRVSFFSSGKVIGAALAVFTALFGIYYTFTFFSSPKTTNTAAKAKGDSNVPVSSPVPPSVGTQIATKGYNLFSAEVSHDAISLNGQSRVFLYNFSGPAVEPPSPPVPGNGSAPAGPSSEFDSNSKSSSNSGSSAPGGLLPTSPGHAFNPGDRYPGPGPK